MLKENKMSYTQEQYIKDNEMRYTAEQLKQIGKIYTDLMYRKITFSEAQSTFNVPKECGVYRNIEQNVNQLRRQIRHGAPMWSTPIGHIKEIYIHLTQEDKRMYIRNVINMAYRYDKTSTMQWANARQAELDDNDLKLGLK